jgi:hypothetical protein
LQVTASCFAPFKQGKIEQEAFVVVVIGAIVEIKASQRFPVYCTGQMHEHDDAKKKPPFKQESKPHLHIG